jgi:hypothetical protein
LNIGKDRRMGFKHAQRFAGIACLQHIKAGLFQQIGTRRTNGSSSTMRTVVRVFSDFVSIDG